MKIKVCGLTSVEQIEEVQNLNIDFAGLIFYEGSKRFAEPKLGGEKLKIKHLEIKKIGVFVNADYKTIVRAISEYNLYAVQLHGDETDEFCLELMDKAKVIKVFRIKNEKNIDSLVESFQAVCHYYLFDTDTAAYGGSGKQFNWAVLEGANISKPFFLSGGISPEDVEKIKNFQHPYLYAVDVNSGFETALGIKDINKVEAFVKALNNG